MHINPELREQTCFQTTLRERLRPVSPVLPSGHPRFARRDLAALVVEDFGVAVLPSANYWWAWKEVAELGRDPTLQRISTQVLRDNQVCLATDDKARQPQP